ncbi:molybdate transport system substrate-binding protein [Geomicrobium halophilum]|uniref:Molybdate transport system substrate-binding protein n=1 Tax=Geomicrobium halophilum TaxID=549000 RepID=A0A841PMW4_9BACL|nr:molybdate ABC transporter substrate-binding protein [Geomicrobium halophilum]MBB6450100.1 molybdate transport system substrate-binding protein [Geomicrobium halophilum]
MKTSIYLFILTLTITMASACSSSQETEEPVEIQIAAASSLQNVLGEMEEKLESTIEGVDVVFQFGGSGSLRRQIEQGAPFDIFLSASEAHFDALVEDGKIDPENSTSLFTNSLVLIQPADTEKPIANVDELKEGSIETIAIGTPESVPAGTFAKETLKQLHMWNDVEDKMVQARSVRQVLTYTEENSVDAGFVYATDAASTDSVETVETIDPHLHSNIVYPIGVIEDTDHPAAAAQVFEYLVSNKAKSLYEKNGYEVAD